jgi:hypothetical protein
MAQNRHLAILPAEEPEEVTRYRLIKRVQKENNYPRLDLLVKKVKQADENISRKQVQEFLEKDVATQVTM